MSEKTVTVADIEREALALEGVPFRHQGSDPGTGVDCRGLIEWLALRLFGRPVPHRDYQRVPSGREFYESLRAEMDEIPKEEARAGDVVLIRFPRDTEARHGGVLARGPYELMIVHAFETDAPGKVITEPYRGWPARCTRTAFRFRGVVE